MAEWSLLLVNLISERKTCSRHSYCSLTNSVTIPLAVSKETYIDAKETDCTLHAIHTFPDQFSHDLFCYLNRPLFHVDRSLLHKWESIHPVSPQSREALPGAGLFCYVNRSLFHVDRSLLHKWESIHAVTWPVQSRSLWQCLGFRV